MGGQPAFKARVQIHLGSERASGSPANFDLAECEYNLGLDRVGEFH